MQAGKVRRTPWSLILGRTLPWLGGSPIAEGTEQFPRVVFFNVPQRGIVAEPPICRHCEQPSGCRIWAAARMGGQRRSSSWEYDDAISGCAEMKMAARSLALQKKGDCEGRHGMSSRQQARKRRWNKQRRPHPSGRHDDAKKTRVCFSLRQPRRPSRPSSPHSAGAVIPTLSLPHFSPIAPSPRARGRHPKR